MMPVKRFKSTNTEQTVELINHQWMIRERPIGDELNWKTIAGPFESMSGAIDTILATPDVVTNASNFDGPAKDPDLPTPSQREVIHNQ